MFTTNVVDFVFAQYRGGQATTDCRQWIGQALFIRWLSRALHSWHSLTRYGSRENAVFRCFVLSVRICIDTLWSVSRSHCAQYSVNPSKEWSVVAIVNSFRPNKYEFFFRFQISKIELSYTNQDEMQRKRLSVEEVPSVPIWPVDSSDK